MRKFSVCVILLTMDSLVSFATGFPYGASMTTRFESEDIAVASLDAPYVVRQESAMPGSDSLAVVKLDKANFQAMDEETWIEATNQIGTAQIQAAFTLRNVNETLVWMGYSGGQWLQLSGVTPAEGFWDVLIQFDYSLGASNRKIRYLIRPWTEAGTGDYVALGEWITIGVEKTVISGVDLYGFSTADAASAESGARQASGNATGLAACNMDYSTLDLTVTRTSADVDTWADQVKVVVKEGGVTKGTLSDSLPAKDGSVAFNLSSLVTPGETFTYEVSFVKTYGGATSETGVQGASGSIDLFASVDWFGFNGSAFVNANTGNIIVEDGKFGTENEEAKGEIDPVTPSEDNQQTIVENVLNVQSASPFEELSADLAADSQFAVALAVADGVRSWAYYDGSKWIKDANGIATDDGEYTGVATFDYRAGKKSVTYTITKGSVTKTLATVALGSATKLSGVDVMGDGFGAMNARCKTTGAAPVTPAGDTITLTSNAKVDLAELSSDTEYTVAQGKPGQKFHLRWEDATGKHARMSAGKLVVSSGATKNGLASFFNYVTGLEAGNDSDANNLPLAVIKPGVAQTDGVELHVPNVKPAADSGYTVYFQIQRSQNGGNTWANFGDAVQAGGQLKIPLTGVNDPYLYRVNTQIK